MVCSSLVSSSDVHGKQTNKPGSLSLSFGGTEQHDGRFVVVVAMLLRLHVLDDVLLCELSFRFLFVVVSRERSPLSNEKV